MSATGGRATRWSAAFVPTLREAPADDTLASARWLSRAGFVRPLGAGQYAMLPLGLRVQRRIEAIVRAEFDAVGGQEWSLPVLQPARLWERSGRWTSIGPELFRLTDRRDAEHALAMTHEEAFTELAGELQSWRQLPQRWYQLQTKLRDEARPRGGLFRVREFVMADLYSFDTDPAGMEDAYAAASGAFERIFERLALPVVKAEASSGSMGGATSAEYLVLVDAGEDHVVTCTRCGYAANRERATSAVAPAPPETSGALEELATPGVKTIADLTAFEPDAASARQIKTLVVVADGVTSIVLVRGDHQVELDKVAAALGVATVEAASDEAIVRLLGASPGSLGPVGVSGVEIVADRVIEGASGMYCGANRDGWHLRGVDLPRDVTVSRWADVRAVADGDACVTCGSALTVARGLEVGHVFQLGLRYADAFGLTVRGADGSDLPVWMGSYGIGIGRALAAVAEVHHDDAGLRWPAAIAPHDVVVTVLRPDDPATAAAAAAAVDRLVAQGLDVLVDDRDARPGVKFADAELIGVPWRVTVGPRGVADGTADVQRRSGGDPVTVPLGDLPNAGAWAQRDDPRP